MALRLTALMNNNRTHRRALAFLLLAAAIVAAADKPDVEYAKVGPVRLTLDAHVPDGPGPFPAAIVVHGGGFIAGDKQTYVKPILPPLTRAGFTWFSINYRLAPAYRFPAAAEDIERAVKFVKKHASEYKVDPSRIALIGESAGGHLVSYVGAHASQSARVAAVVSFYGPHDLAGRASALGKISKEVQAFLGVQGITPESLRVLRDASPISYAHSGMPPYLLIHGTNDSEVPYDQSVRMCGAMKQAGAVCEIFTVAGAGHGVEDWEQNPSFQAYKDKMIVWLRQTLRPARHT